MKGPVPRPKRRRRRLAVAVLLATAAGLAFTSNHLLADPSAPASGRTVHGSAHPVPARSRLVFREEFDGDSLDGRRWNDCHWWAVDGGCTIQTNNELQWYRPENVSVANGRLRLQAREESVEGPDGRRFAYTSGMVTTGPAYAEEGRPAKRTFTYGYVEARLRLPADTGLWPAFWMLPADEESKPEIDILETIDDRTREARFHFHYRDGADTRSLGHTYVGPNLAAGWHRVAVDWRPGRITWIVDGRARWEVRGEAVPDEPMYLVLNLAVGGNYPDPPDESTDFPATMKVDWVRVWQRTAPR